MRKQILLSALLYTSFAAPFAFGQQWREAGPYGGSAEFIRVSKSRPETLISGTRRGTIFRSDDSGANWTRMASPAPADCVMHALELHPANQEQWYAGFDCDSFAANAGLYETSDGGRTWQRPLALTGIGVWSIAFSASSKRTGAGTTAGVFWNTGEGWRRISPESNRDLKPVVSLAFDPEDENILFAGTTHLPWRTVDGGQTWTSIHSGMLDDSDVFSISPDHAQKSLVYASACSGAYRSTTGGSRWTRLPTPPGAFRVYLVVPDPHRSQVVFAATSIGLLRSPNSGISWTRLIGDIVHSVAFHPRTPNRMYVASVTAGILTSGNGGAAFEPVNRGFSDRSFRSLRVSGQELYVTAQGEGQPSLFHSVDGGTTWNTAPAWPKDLRHLTITDGSSPIVFAASSLRVHRSSNAAKTWTALPDMPGGRILALAATRTGVLAAGPKGLFAWTQADWKPVPLPEVEPIHGLYAGADGFLAVSGAKAVQISTDSGATWRVCDGIPDPGSIHSLTGAGGAQGFVLMGTTGGLMRSGDGCRTWSQVRGGLNGDTIALVSVDEARSSIAFAIQHHQIFISVDRGRSWKTLNDGDQRGDFPLAIWAAGTSPLRLFALNSRTGVMIREVVESELLPPTAYSDKEVFEDERSTQRLNANGEDRRLDGGPDRN